MNPSRRRAVRAVAGLLASTILALPLDQALPAGPAALGPEPIEIAARPLPAFELRNSERTRFGSLEYRGGLELTSRNANFGGLSGLKVYPGGERFIAVTDKGRWLRGRIAYENGRPSGVADAEMAPILGPDGRPATARGWYDSEALTEDQGVAYVAFERVNRILRFDFGHHGLSARGEVVPVPPGVSRLPHNKGLEGLALLPGSGRGGRTLVAVSERGLDAAGNIRGFLIGGGAPGEFSIRRSDDFDVSDCAFLPGGDLLLLERSFSWFHGVAMRLRRIAFTAIKPGALVDGEVLLEADMRYQIDNMEGLGVHTAGNGETILTLVSDDNFSILQRTILLQFALKEE